ncbi:c-type cytochrome [Oceanospirillum sediminis]|uniref:Cytochrome c4 n=1 Tax=Oceanospirillum sediminis TaxID=2760088 RepID=A0A839ILZ2_9GAMM|nr:c-type cytochrome [Oceanospirillum sediminis]MBB1486423.1 cytochrome c4 [Oceanospirillum sediminis]
MKKLLVGLTVSLSLAGFAHAAGDAKAGEAKAAVCAGCHGVNGVAMIPNYPSLAGQHESYLAKQIMEIRDGVRKVPEMTGMVTGFSDQDAQNVAAYFSAKPKNLGQSDPATLERGRELYRAGDMAKGIPACTACHSPNGMGNAQAKYPVLSGQNPAYTEAALKKFRDGARTNDPNKMMSAIAAKMSDKDIQAVSNYVFGLN